MGDACSFTSKNSCISKNRFLKKLLSEEHGGSFLLPHPLLPQNNYIFHAISSNTRVQNGTLASYWFQVLIEFLLFPNLISYHIYVELRVKVVPKTHACCVGYAMLMRPRKSS